MVLEVQRIPAAVFVHESLPLVDDPLQFRHLPFLRAELPTFPVIDAFHDLEVEDHVQLIATGPDAPQNLIRIFHPWHLPHVEGIVLLHDAAHDLQEFVDSMYACVMFRTVLVLLVGSRDLGIWQCWIFADEVDDVHSEAVDALLQPIPHGVVDCFAHCVALPIEVRLLTGEKMQVVLASRLIVGPCAAAEVRTPVVGWMAVALFVVPRLAPNVPVSERIVFRRF